MPTTVAKGTAEGAPRRDAQVEPFAPSPPLQARARRLHLWALAAIVAFGLFRAVFAVASTQLWSPVDEAQHLGYVESLARGWGIPTVGRDLLSDEILESLKTSEDSGFRSRPLRPDDADPNWASTRHQYQAIHGPTYYLMMVPAYWVGAPAGTVGSLYAVRVATALVALATVPALWLLARRLFPRRPWIWVLAPAVLVTVESTVGGAAGNDALVLFLGTASLLALLRALDDPRRAAPALLAGAALGATIVTKTTALVLLPMAAVAVAAWLWTRRPPPTLVARWVLLVAAGGAAALAPWVAWNLWAYGAVSAAAEVDRITGVLNPPTELSLAGIGFHLTMARTGGLWASQLTVDGTYRQVWEVVALASLAAGIAGTLVRRRRRELAALLWCAAALPLAFVSMEVLVFVMFDGRGGPMGRHLAAALGPTAIVIAAGPVLALGQLWGRAVVAVAAAVMLALAVPLNHEVIDRTYLERAEDPWGPVRTQTWSDGLVQVEQVRMDVGCPVGILAVGLDPAPDRVTLTGTEGTVVADLDPVLSRSVRVDGPAIPAYRLPAPISGPLVLAVPEGSDLNAAGGELAGWAGLVGAPGDPVAIAWCVVQDPEQVAFDAVFPTLRPDFVDLSHLRAPPVVAAGLGGLAALVTVVLTVVAATRRAQASSSGRERVDACPPGP